MRAQTRPYPGAFLTVRDESIRYVWECRIVRLEHEGEVGSLTSIEGELGLFCKDGVVIPLRICYQGKDCSFSSEISRLL